MSTKKQNVPTNQPTHSVSKVVDTYRKESEEFDTEITELVGAGWQSESGKLITIKIDRDTILLKGNIVKVFLKTKPADD